MTSKISNFAAAMPLNTADSAAVTPPVVARSWDTGVCTILDSPVAPVAERGTGRVPFASGLRGEGLSRLPGYDSGVMTLVIVIFLLLSANFRHYSTFVKTFAQDLWDVRRRTSGLPGGHTVSETRIVVSLVVLAFTCEGVLAYSVLHARVFAGMSAVAGLVSCIGVAGGYYLFQALAYNVTGYAFASPDGRVQWLRGFNASQSLLGLALVAPALVGLFNPDIAPGACAVGIVFYIVARIIFIFKGFRVFYENFFSLLYFILYFCTLEIAPLLILLKVAR